MKTPSCLSFEVHQNLGQTEISPANPEIQEIIDNNKISLQALLDLIEQEENFPLKINNKMIIHTGFIKEMIQDTNTKILQVDLKAMYKLTAERNQLLELSELPDKNPCPVIKFQLNGEINPQNLKAKNPAAQIKLAEVENYTDLKLKLEWPELIQKIQASPFQQYCFESESCIIGIDDPRYYIVNASLSKNQSEIIIYLTDITANRSLEKIKENMIYSVSHDGNNALLRASEELNNLKEEGQIQNSEIHDPLSLSKKLQNINYHLPKALFAIKQAIGINQETLDFDRMTQGKEIQLKKESFDIEASCHNIFNYYQIKGKNNNNQFIWKYDNQIPEYVIGDEIRILRVIENLLKNANKFTIDGRIKLSIQKNPDTGKIDFKISDNGCGINDTDLKNLFRIHFQTNEGQAQIGHGLGLAKSQEIVRSMGGEISVSSQQGETHGTEFQFSLDLPAGEKPQLRESNNQILKDYRILILDDDESLHEFYLRSFSKQKTECISSPLELEEKLKQSEFDIIILDQNIVYRGKNYRGTDLARHLREVYDFHGLIISNSGSELQHDTEFQKALEEGVIDLYHTKGKGNENLLQSIHNLIYPEKNSL
ncbi:MAG TPA: hybrid sensor histidine kinase/response regulator, partial [Candidatus Gracilibacteria bacterium]|nr:hybrid sensor histidine kinase/response regulator [Candidatus Gracilibacteria bacterium]